MATRYSGQATHYTGTENTQATHCSGRSAKSQNHEGAVGTLALATGTLALGGLGDFAL